MRQKTHRTIDSRTGSLFDEIITSSDKVKLPRFPSTRYQGSKRKIIGPLLSIFSDLHFNTALDLFSGTGTVSLLLRVLGKKVDANDYLKFNALVADMLLKATPQKLNALTPEETLPKLLNSRNGDCPTVVTDQYQGIFFTNLENQQIDQFCHNVKNLEPFAKSVYIYAVGQALMKKRPYNLFHRANLSMRTKNVARSFGNAVTWETPIAQHAIQAVKELQRFPFPSVPSGESFCVNASASENTLKEYDLIYADPPYLNKRGIETDYSNFYGFLNGLCDYKVFENCDARYPHKPILESDSGWKSAHDAIHQTKKIAARWPNATIVFSYRSDGVPSSEALLEALSVQDRQATLINLGELKYALSKEVDNQELCIVSRPNNA